jgi:hypothetical protein
MIKCEKETERFTNKTSFVPGLFVTMGGDAGIVVVVHGSGDHEEQSSLCASGHGGSQVEVPCLSMTSHVAGEASNFRGRVSTRNGGFWISVCQKGGFLNSFTHTHT